MNGYRQSQLLFNNRRVIAHGHSAHFALRLPDRAADHVNCHSYPRVNQARELRCWSNSYSNTALTAVVIPVLTRSRNSGVGQIGTATPR